jgi:tetratricopeptide (TPR) repeat protein
VNPTRKRTDVTGFKVRGLAGCGLGDFGEGEALCEEALRYALEIDDPVSKAFVEFVYGILYIHKGDGKEAAEHLQKCIRYQEEKELIPLTGVAWTHLGLDNGIVSMRGLVLHTI